MPHPHPLEPDFLARLRRIFADGIPDRLDRMRGGLAAAGAAAERETPPDSAPLEALFLAAHSLKGTAPTFDEFELAHAAAELADLARRWSEAGAVAPDEHARADRLLEQIATECRRIVETTPPAAQ